MILAWLSPPPQSAIRFISEAQSAARIVRIAARYCLFRAKSLSESLFLWWLLRRRGFAVEMRIGTRVPDGRLEAHSWVEYNGDILSATEDVQADFTRFDRAILGTQQS